MKRVCFIYKSSNIYKRCIAIDVELNDSILKFLENRVNRKKFDQIVNHILEQRFYYYDNYVKLPNGISEMRIYIGNVRIYCKEIHSTNGFFYVIAAKLEMKKSQKINKSIQQAIKPIEDYEYDL